MRSPGGGPTSTVPTCPSSWCVPRRFRSTTASHAIISNPTRRTTPPTPPTSPPRPSTLCRPAGRGAARRPRGARPRHPHARGRRPQAGRCQVHRTYRRPFPRAATPPLVAHHAAPRHASSSLHRCAWCWGASTRARRTFRTIRWWTSRWTTDRYERMNTKPHTWTHSDDDPRHAYLRPPCRLPCRLPCLLATLPATLPGYLPGCLPGVDTTPGIPSSAARP